MGHGQEGGGAHEKTHTERNPPGHVSLEKQTDPSELSRGCDSEFHTEPRRSDGGDFPGGGCGTAARHCCRSFLSSPTGSCMAGLVSPREGSEWLQTRARRPGWGIRDSSASWGAALCPAVQTFSAPGRSHLAGGVENLWFNTTQGNAASLLSLSGLPVLPLFLLKPLYMCIVARVRTARVPGRYEHDLRHGL